MGHGRMRMYNELPEPPARRPARTRNRTTSQLEAAQQQRRRARGRLGELYVWRAQSAAGQTAVGIDRGRGVPITKNP